MQRLKKYWVWVVMALLLTAAGVMIYSKLHSKTLPENLIAGTGRIDGDLINLNTKYPGRVSQIAVEEGERVKRGEVVARLESAEQEAKRDQIAAEIEAKRKILAAKEVELQIAKKRIPLALKKARSQLDASRSQRKGLDKNIAIQRQLFEQARRDFKRSRMLFKSHSVDKHSFELAKLKYETEKSRLEALEEKRREVDAMIRLAEASVAEADASLRNIEALEDTRDSLVSGIKALEAAKAGIDAVLDEMTLKSPVEGYVVEKIANIGEVVGAGMPVLTLIDPHSLYLKIFVDTIQNGKIELGDKAEIFLDAYPDRPIAAKVVRIAQKAEFTPKEVSVRSDRIQRVFAVDLQPLQVDKVLKLGLPAIGVVSLDGKGLPASLSDMPPL